MQFLMVLKIDADKVTPPSPELMGAVERFTEDSFKRGILIQTGGMASTAQTSSLRVSEGKVSVTDGPFAETKEQVGGYAIVDVRSKEEAIELATSFLQLHVDILGKGFAAESEIRVMYPVAGIAVKADHREECMAQIRQEIRVS